jgi:hypothetical protein
MVDLVVGRQVGSGYLAAAQAAPDARLACQGGQEDERDDQQRRVQGQEGGWLRRLDSVFHVVYYFLGWGKVCKKKAPGFFARGQVGRHVPISFSLRALSSLLLSSMPLSLWPFATSFFG